MKISKNEIVFLIRTYNEEKRIFDVMKSIREKWFENILVVDDWSTDKTEKLIKKIENIIYIKHPFNRWWWAALKTWFEYLRREGKNKWFKYVVTFDADWQHSIDDIDNFISSFEKDHSLDIVLGSRFIKKTNSNVPLHRKIVLFWWIIFTYIISHIYLTDSHNWYRMLKISILKKIRLTMDGMEYASELTEQIKVNNLNFREVPVNIKYDEYTLAKWQKHGWPLRIAMKMIFSKFFK